MSVEPRKEVYSLIKHDLANIYNCGSEAVHTDGYRDHWLEENSEVMESFIEDLGAAVDDLDIERGERPDLNPRVLGELTNYDPSVFHEEFSRYVKKVNKLAGLAKESYLEFERTQDYEKGWVKVSDVFTTFDGFVDFNDYEDDLIRGDGSLACVLNTLEDNANRHGGENVETYAKVNPGSYNIFNKHLASSRNVNFTEAEDRWVEAETERDYKILVWDDGEGIADDFNDTDELFNKGTGKNSGLGLPLSREIIEYFDGEMNILRKHPKIPEQSGLIASITLPGKKIETQM